MAEVRKVDMTKANINISFKDYLSGTHVPPQNVDFL